MPEHTRQEAVAEDETRVLKRRLLQTQMELAKTKDELASVYASRSWRCTIPLRWLFTTLRGYPNIWKRLRRLAGGHCGHLACTGLTLADLPSVPYEEQRDFAPEHSDVKLIAYYLPQFHAFPENDAWWGKNFTEWTNVRRARPFFPGHVQPAVPHASLGYYDLSGDAAPDVMSRQIALAKRHGVHGFCFHHYWFSGKRLMERPVDALLERQDIDLPFCLNWANENWTRRWDGMEQEILIAQQHSPEDDRAFMRDALRYFRDPRYIRIKGRPVLLVYHAELLPDAEKTLARWRGVCAEEGETEPFCVMVQSFMNLDPRRYGFDAAAQFPPHPNPTACVSLERVGEAFKGTLFPYKGTIDSIIGRWTKEYTLFPGVMPAWDNTPRRLERASIFLGATPKRYEAWLRLAREYAESALPSNARFVFINSWNEWAEGAQLEPSEAHGFAYLNATARALKV